MFVGNFETRRQQRQLHQKSQCPLRSSSSTPTLPAYQLYRTAFLLIGRPCKCIRCTDHHMSLKFCNSLPIPSVLSSFSTQSDSLFVFLLQICALQYLRLPNYY